jgi:hypothetical protein
MRITLEFERQMREFNALKDYPQPKQRLVGANIRTIKNKIAASYRDERYYDGKREDGYGGYIYDGRWKRFVSVLEEYYGLTNESRVLQIGCEKGFLMHDIQEKYPNAYLIGYEMSSYAIDNSMPSIKKRIMEGRYEKLPFENDEFDVVIAIGVVYALTLGDCISCLKEIERVGKGNSFITLGAYVDEKSKRLFKDYWSLLGSAVFHQEEWKLVLEEAGYSGDYMFATSETLNLVEE